MTYLTSRLCSAVWKIKVISRLISGSIDLWTTELCLMSTINHMWCSLCFCGFSCMIFKFLLYEYFEPIGIKIIPNVCILLWRNKFPDHKDTNELCTHLITSRNMLCVFNGLIHKSIWIFKISVSDYQHGI